MMKKLMLAGVALVVLSGPAVAADMAARTYAKAPIAAPLPTWAGCYLGAMGGYAASSGAPKGGFLGGTAGYNWQSGNIVVGIEADAAWADISGSTTTPTILGIGTGTAKIQDWGTVRGRFGRSFGQVLLYGTAGVAWEEMKLSLSVPRLFTASDSHFHTGWTAGGGVEWMFAPKWSLKVEHLYRSFAAETYSFNVLGRTISRGAGNVGMHSAEVGVNYHF